MGDNGKVIGSIIPEGKVLTVNGELIDRADACFKYKQHPKNKDLFFDSKGQAYIKDKSGAMRKFPGKEIAPAFYAYMESVYNQAYKQGYDLGKAESQKPEAENEAKV